jgi:hypothetical protein
LRRRRRRMMTDRAGRLSPVQFIYSVGLHLALLLPLLALPVTTAESGDWHLEDYVLYLMLKNPEPAASPAALPKTPPVSQNRAAVIKQPETKVTPGEKSQAAVKGDIAEQPPPETSSHPAEPAPTAPQETAAEVAGNNAPAVPETASAPQVVTTEEPGYEEEPAVQEPKEVAEESLVNPAITQDFSQGVAVIQPRQESPNALEGLIRTATVSPFSEEGATSPKEGSAAPSSIDLSHTPGSFLPPRSASPGLQGTAPGEGAPIFAGNIGDSAVIPAGIMIAGSARPTTTGESQEPSVNKEGAGVRPPAVLISDYAPLKISISSSVEDLADLSTKLLRKEYPAAIRRNDTVQEVNMREEQLPPVAGMPQMVMLVPGAGRGTYMFSIVNNKKTPRIVNISFHFYQGSVLMRTRQYKAAALPAGGSLTYRFIIPDAIFWDEDDRFGGSIEDSDSITKFNDKTGLFWREEKIY